MKGEAAGGMSMCLAGTIDPVRPGDGVEMPQLAFAVCCGVHASAGRGGSLIAAAAATMVVSMVTIVIARDVSRIHGALTTLALAGAVLVVIAHAIAPRHRPYDVAPLAVALAIETHGRRR
jgi:O-antigen ligase